jgi:hypothetical protein
MFSWICLVQFTFKRTKVKKFQPKWDKFLDLWLKSNKNVKQTKVEKSQSVSNCLGKSSFMSQKFRDGNFLNELRFFLKRVLPSVNELRKNLSRDKFVASFAQPWTGINFILPSNLNTKCGLNFPKIWEGTNAYFPFIKLVKSEYW